MGAVDPFEFYWVGLLDGLHQGSELNFEFLDMLAMMWSYCEGWAYSGTAVGSVEAEDCHGCGALEMDEGQRGGVHLIVEEFGKE